MIMCDSINNAGASNRELLLLKSSTLLFAPLSLMVLMY